MWLAINYKVENLTTHVDDSPEPQNVCYFK